MNAARLILMLITGYATVGTVVAVAFLAVGAARTDAATRGAGWGFRTMVVPGVVGLWPVVLWRWGRGLRDDKEWGRAQRRWHLRMWLVVSTVALAGLAVALTARQRLATEGSNSPAIRAQ